jgi:hypothetical protein
MPSSFSLPGPFETLLQAFSGNSFAKAGSSDLLPVEFTNVGDLPLNLPLVVFSPGGLDVSFRGTLETFVERSRW